MKNITFSAEEGLIEAARKTAQSQNTTLNDEFRRWLTEYVNAHAEARAEKAMQTIRELQAKYSTGGRKFTRDELNER